MKSAIIVFFLIFFVTISVINFQSNTIQPDDNQYLLHAESSERLLQIMQEINPIAGQKIIEEPANISDDEMTDLIEAVEELLFYAELMSVKVPANVTEENKSVIFSAMASKLYDEALNIQELTKNYNFHIVDHSEQHIIDEAFERLNQTCIACHQLFREQ